MACAPHMTKSMLRLIKRKKKDVDQFIKRCDTCSDKLGVYQCGSCGEKCCKRHSDEKKKQFIISHFTPEYWQRCNETGHVDHHTMTFQNEMELFDHIASHFVNRCAGSSCRAKKYCPECTIDLQYAYCVDCIGISGNVVEKTNHYCSKCISDGKLVDFMYTRSKRIPTIQINPFDKTNNGVFQLLCQYHAQE